MFSTVLPAQQTLKRGFITSDGTRSCLKLPGGATVNKTNTPLGK